MRDRDRRTLHAFSSFMATYVMHAINDSFIAHTNHVVAFALGPVEFGWEAVAAVFWEGLYSQCPPVTTVS